MKSTTKNRNSKTKKNVDSKTLEQMKNSVKLQKLVTDLQMVFIQNNQSLFFTKQPNFKHQKQVECFFFFLLCEFLLCLKIVTLGFFFCPWLSHFAKSQHTYIGNTQTNKTTKRYVTLIARVTVFQNQC